jgi:type VI secretion system protein
MQLIVTIENGPQPEMSGKTWRCGTEGGTLGRNPDCDLVLADPKRYTSSQHARIEFDQDRFMLIDQSTNGTYHNSPKTLIGKNRSVSLDDGDRLFIGDFVLRVDVEDAASDKPPRPEAGQDTSQVGTDQSTGDAWAQREDEAGGDSEPWDVGEFSLPWDGSGTEPGVQEDASNADEDQSFSQSPEREYFAAPSATPSGGDAIPDDWDDFLTGFHDVGQVNKPEADAGEAPESPSGSDDDSGPDSGRRHAIDEDEHGAEAERPQPFAEAEPGAEDRFEPPPAPAAEPGARREPDDRTSAEPAPEAPAEPPPRPPPGEASESEPPRSAPRQPAAASAAATGGLGEEEIHDILRVVTEGLMTLLQGRSEIKNEFRISQTRFSQAENNPLKFSPNAEEALSRILAQEKSPGFLTGKRAFESAFDDIQAHQLAILSAVQRAIESAVSSFDPAELEKKLARISPLSAKTPGLKAAKCWNLFTVHYEEVAGKMRDDARQLFVAEFAEAYEEACRAVAEGRRRDHS